MRQRFIHRVLRAVAHVRHAGRTRFLRPRHVRGRGSHKRRGRG